MSRIALLSLVVLALTAPGCTLLVNGNQYVGDGVDGGPMPDTGPRPDTGADAGNDSAVDTGPHVNSPPVVTSLGLDNYSILVGATARAVAGRVVDPDGDPTSLHFQWFVNGTMRASATGPTLDTTSLAAADMIHVEAWANDGMVDGPHISTNDIPLLADVTQWRQLLPNEDDRLPLMVWDAPNHRIVRILDGGVWEYTLQGSSLRVTQLPTTGTPPPSGDENAIVLFDEARRRMILYIAGNPSLYILDITHGGGLTWTTSSASGGPTDLLLATTFYDPVSRRAFVVGGKDDTLGALDAFYALDLSSAGGESWSTVTPTGTFPRMFSAAVAADRTTPGRYYLLGGVTSTVGTSTVRAVYSAVDHVQQLDVSASGAVTITARSGVQPAFWGAVAATTSTNHALIYGGFDVFGVAMPATVGPQTYDIATDAFSPLPGTPPHAALLGTMVEDPIAPGHFTAVTIGASALIGGATALQYDDVTEAGITMQATRSGPPSIVDSAARLSRDGNTLQALGGQDRPMGSVESWALDVRTLQWSPLTIGEDIATHTHPEVRFGVINDTSNLLGTTFLFQVGGARTAAVLVDMVGFEVENGGSSWLERSVVSGSPPPARVGHVVTAGTCGGTRMMIYGGESAVGTPLGDAYSLNCTVDHACSWDGMGIDAGRSYPAIFSFMSTSYIFGGRTPTGPANDVLGLTQCIGSTPTEVALTITGTPPSPRFASTLVAIPDATGTRVTGYAFGGTDGTASFSDLNILAFDTVGTTGTWASLTASGPAPLPRSHHVAVPDPANRRMLVTGGRVDTGTRSYDTNDVWELLIRP